MKLCNQTSDLNDCRFFFKDRVGKPIYMHLLLKIKVFPENQARQQQKNLRALEWCLALYPYFQDKLLFLTTGAYK